MYIANSFSLTDNKIITSKQLYTAVADAWFLRARAEEYLIYDYINQQFKFLKQIIHIIAVRGSIDIKSHQQIRYNYKDSLETLNRYVPKRKNLVFLLPIYRENQQICLIYVQRDLNISLINNNYVQQTAASIQIDNEQIILHECMITPTFQQFKEQLSYYSKLILNKINALKFLDLLKQD